MILIYIIQISYKFEYNLCRVAKEIDEYHGATKRTSGHTHAKIKDKNFELNEIIQSSLMSVCLFIFHIADDYV